MASNGSNSQKNIHQQIHDLKGAIGYCSALESRAEVPVDQRLVATGREKVYGVPNPDDPMKELGIFVFQILLYKDSGTGQQREIIKWAWCPYTGDPETVKLAYDKRLPDILTLVAGLIRERIAELR